MIRLWHWYKAAWLNMLSDTSFMTGFAFGLFFCLVMQCALADAGYFTKTGKPFLRPAIVSMVHPPTIVRERVPAAPSHAGYKTLTVARWIAERRRERSDV